IWLNRRGVHTAFQIASKLCCRLGTAWKYSFRTDPAVLQRLACTQERTYRESVFGAEILVKFEDAVVALTRVIVTAEEVRLCCRRAPDARRPEILVGGDHHRIYRDAIFVQDELGAGDPGIRNDRSLERVADHILLLLV